MESPGKKGLLTSVLIYMILFEKGYVTLDDLHKCLWDEAGIKLERGKG